MGNMTLFIVGIAILSLGTYLMRLGGAKLGESFSVLGTLAGVAFRRRNGITVLRCAGDHLYEGEHFAGMARVLGVGFAVFLADSLRVLLSAQAAANRGDRCRRGGDRIAAYSGHKLKSASRALFRQY